MNESAFGSNLCKKEDHDTASNSFPGGQTKIRSQRVKDAIADYSHCAVHLPQPSFRPKKSPCTNCLVLVLNFNNWNISIAIPQIKCLLERFWHCLIFPYLQNNTFICNQWFIRNHFHFHCNHCIFLDFSICEFFKQGDAATQGERARDLVRKCQDSSVDSNI